MRIRMGVAIAAMAVAAPFSACSKDSGSEAQGSPSASPGSGESSTGGAQASTAPDSPDAGGGGSSSGEPSDVATVPDDGAPGAPSENGGQADVFKGVPGARSPGCVAVGARRDVKSGGFVAGAFDDARRTFGKAQPGQPADVVRLYWVPLHAKRMPGIRIVATKAGSGSRGKVVRTTVADTQDWKFYDSQIRLPSGGTWTFRATAADDSGCFVVRLPG